MARVLPDHVGDELVSQLRNRLHAGRDMIAVAHAIEEECDNDPRAHHHPQRGVGEGRIVAEQIKGEIPFDEELMHGVEAAMAPMIPPLSAVAACAAVMNSQSLIAIPARRMSRLCFYFSPIPRAARITFKNPAAMPSIRNTSSIRGLVPKPAIQNSRAAPPTNTAATSPVASSKAFPTKELRFRLSSSPATSRPSFSRAELPLEVPQPAPEMFAFLALT